MKRATGFAVVFFACVVLAAVLAPDDAELIWNWVKRTLSGE